MGLNAKKIFLPTPDQSSATGAVRVAPVGTALPTGARDALADAWESGGYVGDAGISIATNKGSTAIKDWSQETVRNALSDFNATITVPFLQTDEFAARRIVGADHVMVQEADTQHGNVLGIDLGAWNPPEESWVFNMKDGDARIRVIVPRGQITSLDAVNFVPNAANSWPGTVSCYPGDEGWSVRVLYDDGAIITVYTEEGLNAMTVDAIKALAKSLGYTITKTTKAEIIEEFLAAQGQN